MLRGWSRRVVARTASRGMWSVCSNPVRAPDFCPADGGAAGGMGRSRGAGGVCVWGVDSSARRSMCTRCMAARWRARRIAMHRGRRIRMVGRSRWRRVIGRGRWRRMVGRSRRVIGRSRRVIGRSRRMIGRSRWMISRRVIGRSRRMIGRSWRVIGWMVLGCCQQSS